MLVLRMSELMLFGVGLLRSPTVTIARSPSDTFAGLTPGGVAAFIGAQPRGSRGCEPSPDDRRDGTADCDLAEPKLCCSLVGGRS
jgi:hypothetical protein